MKHTEVRQFLKEANTVGLSPIEKDVFQYYFSKTNGGEWHCPDSDTAEETFRSRNGVCDARKKLIARNWIEENGQFNIIILKTFSVSFQTQTEDVSLISDSPVSFQTQTEDVSLISDSPVSNETQTGENSVSFQTPYKDKRNIGIEEKLEEKEESKDSLVRLSANDQVREIFEYWQLRLGKQNFTLTDERRVKIKARLVRFSVAQLKQAIDGTFKDDWLMGRAERSTKPYNDFKTIFKNDSEIESLIELSKNGENNAIIQQYNGKPKFETANERRNTDAKRRIEFSNSARQLLESQGIIPLGSS